MKNISCLNAIRTVYLFIQYIKTHYSTWNLRLSCFDEFGEFAFIYLYKKLLNISINLQSQYIKAVLVLVQFEYFKLNLLFLKRTRTRTAKYSHTITVNIWTLRKYNLKFTIIIKLHIMYPMLLYYILCMRPGGLLNINSWE